MIYWSTPTKRHSRSHRAQVRSFFIEQEQDEEEPDNSDNEVHSAEEWSQGEDSDDDSYKWKEVRMFR